MSLILDSQKNDICRKVERERPGRATPPLVSPPVSPAAASTTPKTLADVHKACRRWFGEKYDLDAISGVMAAAAVNRLDGDPLWLLLVSGPGNAKTETAQTLDGAGAHVTSTISSEGALLSGTPARDKGKDATGGLLRKIGPSGVLVIKDVTSILSMNRDTRSTVLAALREVYDGRWERNIGTDGGRTLTWQGRIVVVGAVTTAWDSAHQVVASMGDRFVLLRMDSMIGRESARKHAMQNTGQEVEMRRELAELVGGVLQHVSRDPVKLTTEEADAIGNAADLVTLCRTAVEFDYRGDIIDRHEPEAPTRFAKQLVQMFRGAVAIGMNRPDALRLALRCARDSMPPLRLAVLEDVAKHPHSRTADVARRLDKPRNTVDRQLQALQMLEVLTRDDVEDGSHKVWYWDLREDIDPGVIEVPEMSLHHIGKFKEASEQVVTDISGTGQEGGSDADLCRF